MPALLLLAVLAIAASCVREPDPLAIELRTTSANTASVAGELLVNGAFVAHTMQPLDADGRPASLDLPPGGYSGTIRKEDDGCWLIHLTDNPVAGPGFCMKVSTVPKLEPGVLTLGDVVRNRRDSIRPRKPRSFNEGLERTFFGDVRADGPQIREIEVKIVDPSGPTVFTNERMSFRYEGAGRWEASTSKNKEYLETSRDGGYIVLKNTNTKREIRIPLQGGKLSSKKKASSDNWITRGGAPVLERQN